MLEHFGLDDEANAVQPPTMTSGKGIRTRDVGGSASTEEVTAAIVDHLLV